MKAIRTNLKNPHKNIIFQTEWFDIEEEVYSGIDKLENKPFYRILAPDGVIVLATTKDHKIVMVKQFRPALNKYTIEFPSGAIKPREKPISAAKRELLEETGYICKKYEPLLEGHVMLSRFSSKDYAFWGQMAYRDINIVKEKGIEVLLWNIEELKHHIIDGSFNHFAMISLISLAEWKFQTFQFNFSSRN